MKAFLLAAAFVLFYFAAHGQTMEELYTNKKYAELVKFDSSTDGKTGEQLYMIGFAFYRLENDNKAIALYDRAIAKGFDNSIIHFYKGLSLCYLKRYDEAIKEIETALKAEPTNQEYLSQKGTIYYEQGRKDEALKIFEQAIKLPKTYPEPFFWAARIYHEKGDFSKALAAFYVAADSLNSDNSYYIETLKSIGKLEYTVTKNYSKAAKAYAKAVEIAPKNYELYPKLMKALNADKNYAQADRIFTQMKAAFDKNELSKEDMEFKNAAIDEFEWNGQKLTIYKNFTDPVNPLDVYAKVYLFNKQGDMIERTFAIEKMTPNADGAIFILCETEKGTGTHRTYPYGWKTIKITPESLQKTVLLVLNSKSK